jgi:hypothetical protein
MKKLTLHCPIKEWMDTALNYPGIQILDLTPEIAIESTQLSSEFLQTLLSRKILSSLIAFEFSLDYMRNHNSIFFLLVVVLVDNNKELKAFYMRLN